MKKKLDIPKFKNEDEEFEFWSNIDLLEYFEPSDFKTAIFPNLKFSAKSISIRMPEHLINRLKVLANKADVPYQSYMKMILADKVREMERDEQTSKF